MLLPLLIVSSCLTQTQTVSISLLNPTQIPSAMLVDFCQLCHPQTSERCITSTTPTTNQPSTSDNANTDKSKEGFFGRWRYRVKEALNGDSAQQPSSSSTTTPSTNQPSTDGNTNGNSNSDNNSNTDGNSSASTTTTTTTTDKSNNGNNNNNDPTAGKSEDKGENTGEKQEEAKTTKLFNGGGKCPTVNVLYIYVSYAGVQDYTAYCKGKGSYISTDKDDRNEQNGITNPMCVVDYRGLNAMFPSNCLCKRKFD